MLTCDDVSMQLCGKWEIYWLGNVSSKKEMGLNGSIKLRFLKQNLLGMNWDAANTKNANRLTTLR